LNNKAQSEIITVTLLLGVVLVIGVSLASYVNTNLSLLTAENDVRNFIQNEISKTVAYKELDTGSTLWVGILRIDGSKTTYYILVLNVSHCYLSNVGVDDIINPDKISSGTSGVPVGLHFNPNKIYVLDEVGTYVPLKRFLSSSYTGYVPLAEVVYDGGKIPKLVGVEYGRSAGCLIALVFISVNNELYEVGRLYG